MGTWSPCCIPWKDEGPRRNDGNAHFESRKSTLAYPFAVLLHLPDLLQNPSWNNKDVLHLPLSWPLPSSKLQNCMPYTQHLNCNGHHCIYCGYDFPMHSSAVLLEPHNQGRALHWVWAILVWTCCLEHCHGYSGAPSSDSSNQITSDGQKPEACRVWSFQLRSIVSYIRFASHCALLTWKVSSLRVLCEWFPWTQLRRLWLWIQLVSTLL